MLGQLSGNKIRIEELNRFDNGFKLENGHDRWQIDHLINEIIIGLEKAKKEYGINDTYLGIDTWAVDYVLIDQNGDKLDYPISYHDSRTKNSVTKLTRKYSKEYIYKKMGIQFLDFNTLYQLFEEDKSQLKQAKSIVMIPDYIGYRLTGKAVTEVINASTTQMLNLREGLFDSELLSEVNVTCDMFPSLVDTGTELRTIKSSISNNHDILNCQVITVATHDTVSAVVGTPASGEDDWAFLSSGTWSLIGRELSVPENGPMAFEENYTNEWGAYGTYRFLKNIMGMWIVQRIKHEYQDRYGFAEMAKDRYAAIGVDTEEAIAKLATVPLSIHCWQGDDIHGFLFPNQELTGGIDVSGNFPGAATTPDELSGDLSKALSIIPGSHKVQLHAIYAVTDKKKDLDELEPEDFSYWVDWQNNKKLAWI